MLLLRGLVLAMAAISLPALADDFKQTVDAATVGFEGPSTRATKQFIYSRGTPLEVLVTIEGWYKVRDAQGGLVWVERRTLGERSNVQVKSAAAADAFTASDELSPLAFRVEPGVLLTLVAPPTSGFAQVRTRDGQIGYMRLDTLFGL
ncbi:MAG: SH3 domain-containing protein [Casimicrobium sp.]